MDYIFIRYIRPSHITLSTKVQKYQFNIFCLFTNCPTVVHQDCNATKQNCLNQMQFVFIQFYSLFKKEVYLLFTLSNKYISYLVLILIVLFLPISLFLCHHSLDFMIKSIKIQYTIAIKVIRFYDHETLSFFCKPHQIFFSLCPFLFVLKRSIQFARKSNFLCKSF